MKRYSSYSTSKQPLNYKDKANYYKYIKKYIDVFGKENVLIILYDDIKNDTKNTYKNILKFLEVDVGFEPDFEIKNYNKEVRSFLLRRISRDVLKLIPSLREIIPLNIQEYLRNLTFKTSPRKQIINQKYEDKLRKEFNKNIKKLGELIDKDLSSWKKDGEKQ